MATARRFLRTLVEPGVNGQLPPETLESAPVADWLVAHGLGPLAHGRTDSHHPAFARQLEADLYASAAANSVHFDNLARVARELSSADIPLVVLKGAALTQTAYGGQAQRTMSDLDLWVQPTQIKAATMALLAAGYQLDLKDDRPFALQMMADGEVRFYRPDWPQGLVELHLSPYSGWWLKRTAAIDNDALWARKRPFRGYDCTFQLSPEDMVIHLAVHTAVNHQLGMMALRTLVDIALYSRAEVVDWQQTLARAWEMRVGTAVWLVLAYADDLFALPGLAAALRARQPGRLRLALLRRLMPLESVLHGRDLRRSTNRYLFLLLLVDRLRDTAVLLWRSLFPEREWLAARYGSDHASLAYHVRHVLSNRGI